MKDQSSPETYNLSKRTVLRTIGDKHIAIVKLIKSRIIRKDAQKIIDQIRQIQSVDESMNVSLVCTGNICSKSLALLKEHDVDVYFEPLADE